MLPVEEADAHMAWKHKKIMNLEKWEWLEHLGDDIYIK